MCAREKRPIPQAKLGSNALSVVYRASHSNRTMPRQIAFAIVASMLHLGRMRHDPIAVTEAVGDHVGLVRQTFSGEYALGYYDWFRAEILIAGRGLI